MSATVISFLVILVIAAIFSKKAESAPLSGETPESRQVTQLENITKCPFEVKEDFDASRMPQRIQKVVCKPVACKDCDADFQCVQALVNFEVFYKNTVKPTQLPIEYGCYYTKLDGEAILVQDLPPVSN